MIDLPLIVGAFVAGVLMFLAPCTLPIVPGYLAFIGGKRVMRNAFAFVLGFSLVFILLGGFAGSLGGLVAPYREVLGRIAGAVILLFGLTMLGAVAPRFLRGEWHAKLPAFLTIGRPESSFLIGTLFALGWSPCIGPVLGTVLLFASTSATASQGALLLAVFSLGMAVPFLLTALFIERAGSTFARWGRTTTILQYVGGVLLVLIGIAMLLGNMGFITQWALQYIPAYDLLLNYL